MWVVKCPATGAYLGYAFAISRRWKPPVWRGVQSGAIRFGLLTDACRAARRLRANVVRLVSRIERLERAAAVAELGLAW